MSPRDTILRIPHEPGETVDAGPAYGYSDGTGTDLPPLTETLTPAERHELDAFLADAFADRALMCAEVFDAETIGETRDDGELFHGRVPSEDCDALNPCVIARARVGQIVPPPADGQSIVPAWAYATAGAA